MTDGCGPVADFSRRDEITGHGMEARQTNHGVDKRRVTDTITHRRDFLVNVGAHPTDALRESSEDSGELGTKMQLHLVTVMPTWELNHQL